MSKCKGTLWIVVAALIASAASCAVASPDPYVVLDKYIAAMGGMPKMKSHHANHSKATLVIEGANLEGTIEIWSEEPIKSRQEVDLKVFKQVGGDNGEFAWRVDQNGKLEIARDSTTLKERQLQIRTAAYENLLRGSKVFAVTYDRLDTANGATCHVIKTTNTIDSMVNYSFYDTNSYRQVKTIVVKPTGETHTVNKDFRLVDGIYYPFLVETLELPVGQRITIKVTSLEINPNLDSTLFNPPTEQKRDFRFPTGKSMVQVPFKFIENHIYLPLSVNGKTKLWILDSGAESSVLATGFAKELGLKLEGKLTGQGAGSTVEVSFGTLPPFELNGLAFDSQKVAAIDLDEIARKVMGVDCGGILGYDFLSRLVTKVDYASTTLSFCDPDSFVYRGSGTVIDAPISQSNMFHVPITVDGKYTGLWNLDLGAGGLDFQYPYAKDNNLLERPGLASVGFGAGGRFDTKMGQYKTVTFAGFTKEKPIVTIPVSLSAGAFSTRELIGNAGNSLFRYFVLYLDYKRGQVIVEKGEDFDTKFPFDHSGLQVILADDGNLEVVCAPSGAPAAKAGIVKGDELISVDGKSIEQLGGLLSVREMFRAPVGTAYSLKILRDGKQRDVKITLKELF
jgi:hypothetical protein